MSGFWGRTSDAKYAPNGASGRMRSDPGLLAYDRAGSGGSPSHPAVKGPSGLAGWVARSEDRRSEARCDADTGCRSASVCPALG